MKFLKKHKVTAFSLAEVILATVIIAIAVIGTSAYRYQSAFSTRKTDLYSTGVRTALLLCEGWSGVDGNTTYDPVTTFSPQLNISTSTTGTSAPTGYTKLGYYVIVENGISYFTTLSYKDLTSGGLRNLYVMVKWDLCNRGKNTLAYANQSYFLSTYVKK